jgi:hypothetical protein
MDKEQRDPTRYWVGVAGASALALAIVVGVVMQVRTSKPEVAVKTQAAVRTPAAVKPQAALKPQATPPAQVALKPQAAVKPPMLTAAELKTSETLWVEQKKLDAESARVLAKPDGGRRVVATIAKHFNVPEKLVTDLRGRKLGHGEITVALALSQQLVKREKVTQQKAVDRVLELRKAGHGWAAIARSLGLKLGDAVGHVQTIDQQLARLDAGKTKTARS